MTNGTWSGPGNRRPVRTTSGASAGEVSRLLAAAVYDDRTGGLSLFLVNRDPQRSVEVRADVSATGARRLAEAWSVGQEDARVANTLESPDAVVPRPLADVEVRPGAVRAALPPLSWSVVRVGA
jgi:alpha-N-arabinofuranosidase